MIVIVIIGYVLSLLILYIIIEAAVKNGINKSVIGNFLERKYGIKDEKESFLNNDLDND